MSGTNRNSNLNVPLDMNDEKQHRRILSVGYNHILNGKINSHGTVTLTANAATTTLSDDHIGADSKITLTATTANAAAALASTYFSAPGKKSVVINHANDAQVDKTFWYIIIG